MKIINKNNNDIVIIAHGFGFFFELLLCLCITVLGIVVFILNLLPQNYNLSNIILICCCPIASLICIYFLYRLFYKSSVKFSQNDFSTKGNNSFNDFKPISEKCENFIDYKITKKYMLLVIEFTLKDNRKKFFYCGQFTKNQIQQILIEIKKRGGFKDKEIKFQV